MRSMIQFLGGVILRMGLISLCVSLLGLTLIAYVALNPNGIAGQMFDRAMTVGLLGRLLGIGTFEPDEFIFDHSLGEDVARLYDISIPKLGLYAPVVAVAERQVWVDGVVVGQLHVPNSFAVGWSERSAPIGVAGNTILVGHNNQYGEVFRNLWDLSAGDEIIVIGASGERVYRVSQAVIFEEKGRSLDIRLANAGWLIPTDREQLTLITCWPYYTNTHRLVVVALPV
jgi:LPXTG-site transpeptidase (sortase) family protein